jgi:centromeric protein E
MRIKLEEERRALAALVGKFDSLGLGGFVPSTMRPPTTGGAPAAFAERQQNVGGGEWLGGQFSSQMSRIRSQPNLLEQMPEEDCSMMEDVSFDEKDFKAGSKLRTKEILGGGKENIPA